jgi:hypothetical protein
MSTPVRIPEAIARLKGVFLEIPGTQLSMIDASRRSGLDRHTCGLVMAALEDARFLARSRNGLFVRRTADSPRVD